MPTRLAVKRAYAPAAKEDGFRILVDRLWPRGLHKDEARVDLWVKDVAPSDSLRRWFGHGPAKWQEFSRRYDGELDANPEAIIRLKSALAGHTRATLLYAARDEEHNNAVALAAWLHRQQII
ncbi:MAG: DUF488 family protein [Gammaproteobacteria bacterium]|nr:DUF488 family protein [Gammaproteobacteria bacterium]